jgi:catechol 2,3-dioxygenase-like lactoylglutathione lyase family enzyme
MQRIAHVALVVADYDEAIAFYTQKLHFTLVEDSYQPAQDKRWVVVAPPGSVSADGPTGTTLLLARASTPEQARFVGDQAGGRVFLFLQTDDFWRDYRAMTDAGITFVRPAERAGVRHGGGVRGSVRNRWDLVQFSAGRTP